MDIETVEVAEASHGIVAVDSPTISNIVSSFSPQTMTYIRIRITRDQIARDAWREIMPQLVSLLAAPNDASNEMDN